VLLVVLALLAVATVPLGGRDLRRLSGVRIRASWAAFAAIALQLVITTILPAGGHAVHAALHVVSYGLAAVFVIANRALPGLAIMAAGGGMNLAAIALNGGVMPASRMAMATAGIPVEGGFSNSSVLAHPRLLALGDVIGVPGPWPLGNVLSLGDLVIYAGLLILLHRTCGASRAHPRRKSWRDRFRTIGLRNRGNAA
jgi:Family of unknown function (DUF5317)